VLGFFVIKVCRAYSIGEGGGMNERRLIDREEGEEDRDTHT
jgi:hypothetical protein